MKPRSVSLLAVALVVAAAPVLIGAGSASAAPRPAAVPSTLIATTISMTAVESIGTTGPKITFSIRVKAASGPIPQGHVSLTSDCAKTALDLIVKPTGRISATRHCKAGAHTATVRYMGSTTDAATPPPFYTITFTVT